MPPIPSMPFFDPVRFGIELTYTLVAVCLFFLIYFRTKDLYTLTKHKGIMFFRDAFLFFALSYLLRLVLISSKLYSSSPNFFIKEFFPLSLIFVSYFSTLGILMLMFSTTWKHIKSTHMVFFGHLISLLLTIIIILTNSSEILIYIQVGLLIVATGLGTLFNKKTDKSKKSTQTRMLYFLLLLSWLLNIWMLTPGWFFPSELKSLFQVLSLVVFGAIYYKVSKWLK